MKLQWKKWMAAILAVSLALPVAPAFARGGGGGGRGGGGGGGRGGFGGGGAAMRGGGGGRGFSGGARSFSGGARNLSGGSRSFSAAPRGFVGNANRSNFVNRNFASPRGNFARGGVANNFNRGFAGATRGNNFAARNFTGNVNRNFASNFNRPNFNRNPANSNFNRNFAGYRGIGGYGLGYGGWRGYGRYGFFPYGGFYPFGLWGLGWGWPLWGLGYGGWGGYGGGGYGGYDNFYDGNAYTAAPVAPEQQQQPVDFIANGEDAFRAGQYDAALRSWQHAMVDNPSNGGLVLMMAQAMFALGRYEDAAGAVQMAMQVLPENEWGTVVRNYAQLYGNIGDYTSQLKALEQARNEKPKVPALRFLLGYHFGYLGYPKQAVAELDKALDLESRDLGSQQLRDIFAQQAEIPARPHATPLQKEGVPATPAQPAAPPAAEAPPPAPG